MRLAVRVQPRARTRGIAGWAPDGALRVRVVEAPEDGKANRAVEELLAERLRIAGRQVRVVSGGSSRRKLIEIEGLDMDELQGRLAAAIDEPGAEKGPGRGGS
jgi:uncharacterized protein (TIGR00251 family)